jgi:3-hydroxyisobutyrate dehydrogenase-like beta-hydroxyacid dehydrogenase
MIEKVENPQALRVGIIGVGEMGRPLVDRLLLAGQPIAALVRRPGLRDELAAAGVEMVDSVEMLARGRDIVLLFLFKDEQVRELALETGLIEAMEPGAILVIHTTGSPRTAEAIANRGGARGIKVVDAPVSGGPAKLVAGTITLLVGGEVEDVARCRPLFAAYAGPVLHAGPLGKGQQTKLINNIMFGAHIQLAIEAARVGRAFGLDAGTLASMLGSCSGNSAALEMVGLSGSPESLMTKAGKFIHKDILVATEVARELGVDLALLSTVTAPLLSATK